MNIFQRTAEALCASQTDVKCHASIWNDLGMRTGWQRRKHCDYEVAGTDKRYRPNDEESDQKPPT